MIIIQKISASKIIFDSAYSWHSFFVLFITLQPQLETKTDKQKLFLLMCGHHGTYFKQKQWYWHENQENL